MGEAHLIPPDLFREVLRHARLSTVGPPDPHFVLNARGCQVWQAGVRCDRVDNVFVSLEGADDSPRPAIPNVHPAIIAPCRTCKLLTNLCLFLRLPV